MTLGLAASWPTCSCGCCFAAAFLSTSHRPHIGCQIFIVLGFTTPLQKGSLCTGPMAVDRIQTLLIVLQKYLFGDQGMILKALTMGRWYKKALQ